MWLVRMSDGVASEGVALVRVSDGVASEGEWRCGYS